METRPYGRDEVRAAIIAAAERRFAAEGPGASLRDIAADAGVNLGLLHRHFGTKAALIREVLAAAALRASVRLSDLGTLDDALDAIMRSAVRHDDTMHAYVRMLAWLLLAGEDARDLQDEFPTMSQVVRVAGPERHALVLLTLAAAFGWETFGPHLSRMVGYRSEERAAADLSRALADAVRCLDVAP